MPKGYYHTQESVSEYIQLSKDVNGSKLIQKLKTFLKPGSSILELGSGPGTDWNLLNKDFEPTGSDNSEEFLKRLRAAHPEGQFLELDAASIDTVLNFDAIYSNKVLHHLRDEELEASIARQHEVVNLGGYICHSFWKGEGSEIFKGLFVNYHTEEELKSLFERSFDLVLLEAYEEFEPGDSLLLIARKR